MVSTWSESSPCVHNSQGGCFKCISSLKCHCFLLRLMDALHKKVEINQNVHGWQSDSLSLCIASILWINIYLHHALGDRHVYIICVYVFVYIHLSLPISLCLSFSPYPSPTPPPPPLSLSLSLSLSSYTTVEIVHFSNQYFINNNTK